MKKISKTILFFGNERLATAASTSAPVIRSLTAAGFRVGAVITSHQDSVSHQERDLEIDPIAHSLGIPVLRLSKNVPLIEIIKRHQTNAAVLVAFGKIIPQSVIDLFPDGIINVHPSLLPKLRGPTPVENAILQGLDYTGVSIMKIASKMDAGPVYIQKRVALDGNETKFELAERLGQLAADLVANNLANILDGSLPPSEQNDSEATYTALIKKEDGDIDWRKPAQQLEREVRAFLGWPGSRTQLAGKDVAITKVHVDNRQLKPGQIEKTKQELIIGAGDSSLAIERLKPAGKNEMDIAAFLAGYGNKL